MHNRYSLIFAFVAFAGLFYLAVDHYLIRGLFLDGSFFTFFMVKEGGFNIENYRYGSALTQLLPLSLIKSGAGLRSIVMSYSVSYILYYLVIYLILYFGFKKRGLAWGMLMSLVIMAGASFYWPISELQHGMAFIFILLAVWDFKRNENKLNWISFVALLPLSVLLAGFHPLLMFAWIGAGGYFLIAHKWYANWQDWMVFVLVLAIVVLKNYYLKQPYEESRMEYIKNIYYFFPKYWHVASFREFVVDSIFQYYILSLCLLSMTWYWLHRKRWFSVIWIWACYIGYMLLITCSYPEVGDEFYYENMLLILGFFVALPWGQEIVPHVLQSRFYKFIFLFILCARLLHIQTNHLPFERHLRFYEEQIEGAREEGLQKVLLTDMDKAETELIQTWASSFESMLISSLDSPEETVNIVVIYNEEKWGEGVNGQDSYFTEWSIFPIDGLPHQYLQLGPQPYTVRREAW